MFTIFNVFLKFLFEKHFFLIVRSSVLFQGRGSSDSPSSEEVGGGGSHSGGHQTQTVVQSQVQGSGQPCRALSTGIEIETALQEMEMQTHRLHMSSPHCSPGELNTIMYYICIIMSKRFCSTIPNNFPTPNIKENIFQLYSQKLFTVDNVKVLEMDLLTIRKSAYKCHLQQIAENDLHYICTDVQVEQAVKIQLNSISAL